MSDSQGQGPSTGLVIGVIVGGIVAAVMILGGVFGLGWYWATDAERAWAGNRAELERAEAEIEDIKQAAGPGIPVGNPREHLIGLWDAQGADGHVATMEFRADGKLLMTDTMPGKPMAKQPPVRWDLRSENGGYTITIDTVQGEPNDHGLRFLEDDRMVIDTLVGVIYHRRRAGAAK